MKEVEKKMRKDFMEIMKLLKSIFLLILCAGLLVIQTFAQKLSIKSKNNDVRVEAALKQIDLDYERDEDGDYEVTYQTTGNRRQTAFISPVTDKANGSEVRAVISFAMIGDQPLTLDIANLLLEQNMEKLSYWASAKMPDGKIAIVNLIYIPADADGKKLDTALSIVTLAADKMEEKLNGKDSL